MNDTINRQDAIYAIHEVILGLFDFTDDNIEEPMTYTEEKFLHINKLIAEKIKALPSAQPEPRRGRWIPYEAWELRYICSECGIRFIAPFRYCPNCGAKM